jgi:hypothetical protein
LSDPYKWPCLPDSHGETRIWRVPSRNPESGGVPHTLPRRGGGNEGATPDFRERAQRIGHRALEQAAHPVSAALGSRCCGIPPMAWRGFASEAVSGWRDRVRRCASIRVAFGRAGGDGVSDGLAGAWASGARERGLRRRRDREQSRPGRGAHRGERVARDRGAEREGHRRGAHQVARRPHPGRRATRPAGHLGAIRSWRSVADRRLAPCSGRGRNRAAGHDRAPGRGAGRPGLRVSVVPR